MDTILSKVNSHDMVAVIAIAGGILVAITAIIAGNWARMRRTEMELALKRDMLERGLSAEDIERVLNASGGELKRPRC